MKNEHKYAGFVRALQGRFKGVIRVAQGYHIGVTSVFQGCYKGVTSVSLYLLLVDGKVAAEHAVKHTMPAKEVGSDRLYTTRNVGANKISHQPIKL
jgi:hypothetical protein